MSRAWTWGKRILLGLGAVIVVAIAAVLVTIHTDYGRELIRTQVEARLDDTFVGGASVAGIEGSPFGDLTLTGIVLNGPDQKPAVKIRSLTLELGLLPLLSKQIRLSRLVAEDVDVDLRRDPDGELQVTRMVKPGPESGFSVDIPEIVVRRGHVAFDTGGKEGVVNVDKLTIFGAAHMPAGKPLDANVSLRGSWRERAAGIGVDAVLHSNEGVTSIASVTALLGGVTVAGSAIRIVPGTPGSAPRIDGIVVIHAPAAAVERLMPDLELPADIAVAISAYSEAPWTQISMIGQLGTTPVRAMLSADLDKRRALGVVSSGDLDLAKLSDGKLTGHGGGVVIFDGALGRAGELPVASGVITAWGELLDAPNANVAIAFTTDGERAATVVGLEGDSVTAMLAANVKKIGEAITLEKGTLIASTSNPARASGGKAPIRGAITVNLAASGALAPAPNLAVEGRIKGKRLRAQGGSVATLDLAINAKNLPRQPRGKAELKLTELVHDHRRLGLLEIDAANREDGKIAVAVRSRPKQSPWLLDVDALVTPPGTGDIIAIDIVRHRLRAAKGGDWNGSSGHIEIGPEQIIVRELESHGLDGKVAISATFDRAGRNQGDVIAKVDATGFDLVNISPAYRGRLDARVDVTRTNNRWAGAIDVSAKGLSADPRTLTIDADLKITGYADKLVVAAHASSAGLGSATLAVDVDAPKDIANVEMWKHLHRDEIREARISLSKVDLAKVADLAGKKGEVTGTLDGELLISAASAGGTIKIRDMMLPALRGTGGLNADLRITQTARDELSPVLTGTFGNLATFEVIARLGAPEHLFDPEEWRALGPGVVRGATAKVDRVTIEPGLLDRLGLVTDLRGKASFTAEIGEAMRSAHVALDLRELRGTPIAKPVHAHFSIAIDDKDANTSLAVRAEKVTLLDMRGTVLVTMAELRANPRAVLGLPLDITATIPNAPAPTVLHVFGRSEVTGGTIDGTIKVAGTVGKPTFRATLAAVNLQVPPGPNHKPVKTVEELTLDATWDGTTGKVAIKGTQQNGMLDVVATGSPRALEQGRITLKSKAFDLVPLLVFAPGPAGGAAGRLDANLTVDGLDPHTAKVAGDFHLSDARLPVSPSVGTLRRAKVDIVIGAAAMKIKVDGRLGGGTVKLASTIGLNGAQPTGGDATITLRKISPIGTIEPDVDADIKVKMVREGNRWTADVFVHDGVVKVARARGQRLKPVGAPSDMVFAGSGERITNQPMLDEGAPPERPTMIANITIYSTYVESDEFRGLIKGKLTVSADADKIGVVGQISADRGDLDLFGRRYQLERGMVRFDGSTDPLLDILITYDFPDVTTTTQVRGRLSKPDLIMSSNPGTYSQGQLLGFLLGGEPSGDPHAGSARDKVTGAGASIIANKIGGYVRNALPVDIDVLKYEAGTAGTSAAVTVGTWLSRSLFVAYRRHLEARPDENTGEGEAEYWLSRRVMVEAVVGDRGYHGIDLLWRKRY